MEIIQMSGTKLYNIYKTIPYIDEGTMGVLKKYDENTLIKFYFVQHADHLLVLDYMCDDVTDILLYMTKSSNRKDIERVKKLMERQPIIKQTTLPTGIIITNKFLCASLIPYFKEYRTLLNLQSNLSNKDKIKVLEVVREKVKELTDNYIYPNDLWAKNIMIHPITKDIELIDLDDRKTFVRDSYDKDSNIKAEKAFDELVMALKKND